MELEKKISNKCDPSIAKNVSRYCSCGIPRPSFELQASFVTEILNSKLSSLEKYKNNKID